MRAVTAGGQVRTSADSSTFQVSRTLSLGTVCLSTPATRLDFSLAQGVVGRTAFTSGPSSGLQGRRICAGIWPTRLTFTGRPIIAARLIASKSLVLREVCHVRPIGSSRLEAFLVSEGLLEGPSATSACRGGEKTVEIKEDSKLFNGKTNQGDKVKEDIDKIVLAGYFFSF